MVLNIFALVVIVVLIAAIVVLAVWIGGLPGRIAKSRDHPQADAINACGWLGLITLGPAWIVAMVWAYAKPIAGSRDELVERIARLESEISRLPKSGGAS